MMKRLVSLKWNTVTPLLCSKGLLQCCFTIELLHQRVTHSKGLLQGITFPFPEDIEEEVNTQRDPFVLKASLKNPDAARVVKEPCKYCGEVELAKGSESSRV